MSLDDRLRSGLRTLDEQLSDAAVEWEDFRGWAYPKRARRRVFEAIAAVVVIVALGAGGIAISARKAPQLPGFIRPIPKDLPACGQDLNIIYLSGGDTVVDAEFGLGGNALTRRSCTIDGKVRLTITSRSGHALPIEGNGQVQIIRGVVPPSGGRPGIGVTWEWTNWCGPEKQAALEFVGFDDPALARTLQTAGPTEGAPTSNVPACIDPSKPSSLRAIPWEPPPNSGVRSGGPLKPPSGR